MLSKTFIPDWHSVQISVQKIWLTLVSGGVGRRGWGYWERWIRPPDMPIWQCTKKNWQRPFSETLTPLCVAWTHAEAPFHGRATSLQSDKAMCRGPHPFPDKVAQTDVTAFPFSSQPFICNNKPEWHSEGPIPEFQSLLRRFFRRKYLPNAAQFTQCSGILRHVTILKSTVWAQFSQNKNNLQNISLDISLMMFPAVKI